MKLEKVSALKSTYKDLKRKHRDSPDDKSLRSQYERAKKRLKLRKRVKEAKKKYKSLKSEGGDNDVESINKAKEEWQSLRETFIKSIEEEEEEEKEETSKTIAEEKDSSFEISPMKKKKTSTSSSISNGRVKRADGLFPCTQFMSQNSCKYGDSCKFSHLPENASSDDVAAARKLVKRSAKPCFNYIDGNCDRGDACRYQHLDTLSSKQQEDYDIAKIIHKKDLSQEEKLEHIMKLPVSYRQKGRRMFFAMVPSYQKQQQQQKS